MKRTFLLYFLSLALVPGFAFAQAGRALGFQNILDLLGALANYLYTAAGIVGSIVLVWAGIIYMTAGADPGKAKKAKDIFKHGLIGALILFSIGTLMSTARLAATGQFFLGGGGYTPPPPPAGPPPPPAGQSVPTYDCDPNGQCVPVAGGAFATPSCGNTCGGPGAQAVGGSCSDCTVQGGVWCLADSSCLVDELECPGVFTRDPGGCP